jgi:hypothetical protein
MRPDAPGRRGVALILALLALAVVGTFLVAGFYAARRTETTDRLTWRVAQLDAASDVAMLDVLAQWDSAARFRQEPGSTAMVTLPDPAPRAVARAWLTRISRTLFLATLRSADLTDTSIFVRSSRLLRVKAPEWPAVAALIAGGDVRADGTLRVLAPDSAAGPACPASPSGWAPIAVPPGHVAPGVYVDWDPAGADSTYRAFGGVTLQALAARATVRLTPGRAVEAPSASIILAEGDLDLVGGSGRGLLIVEGRLRLSGPVAFRGVIVALSGLEVSGSAAVVDGIVLVAAASVPAVSVDSSADFTVRFDRCLVEDVAWHAGRPGPVRPRGLTPAP